VGGALGDVGVLLPLGAALVSVNGLSATSVFFGVGVAYIISGVAYRLPIPVQPLKAVSAIAIAQGLSGSVVTGAGWLMSALLLGLAVTDVPALLGKLFTRPIIRGVQLGLGLLLVQSGFQLASRPQIVAGGTEHVIHLSIGTLPLGWLLAVASLLLLAWALRIRRWAASVIVLSFGVLVALILGGEMAERMGQVQFGLNLPRPRLPRISDLPTAFLMLVLPQIPLTLGNAVYATVDTARRYFGQDAHHVTPKALMQTMGVSQLIAALFGGVPVCHGSGGVTAHYKMGARTGVAPVLMGGLCLGLALFVDGNVLPILALIPYSVLGVLLTFIGVQHGLLVRDLRGWSAWSVALVTAGVGIATRNLAFGFAAGMVLDQAIRLARRSALFSTP
jgi:SulP family sulfate permease